MTLYLVRVACPFCEKVAGFVEEADGPVGLMQDVNVSARYCPACGEYVPSGHPEWVLHEETEIERVAPTQEREA